MVTAIDLKESDIELGDNLEYLLLNFPEAYDRKLIDQNIELVVDAYCELKKISDHDYQLIGLIWRYAALDYTSTMIFEFTQIENRGHIPYIKEMTYSRALKIAEKTIHDNQEIRKRS